MRVEEDADDLRASLALIAWLASINLLVLVFNLIPAFPLDGGRIARAIAWRVTGDRNRATRFAARLGQGFSYLFIGVGILLLIAGRRDRRDLAGADRLHPRPVGPRRRASRRSSRAGSRGSGSPT